MKAHELVLSKRVKSISVAGLVAELDLEGVIREQLNHSADLARGKAKLRNVRNQGHGIEQLNLRASGHKTSLIA